MRNDDKWVNYIIASAEEIIDHAEQWARGITYQTGIDINIRIRPDEFPEVECTTTMIPRGVVTALDSTEKK